MATNMVEDCGRVIQNAAAGGPPNFSHNIYRRLHMPTQASLRPSRQREDVSKTSRANQALAIQRRVIAFCCDGRLPIALVFLA